MPIARSHSRPRRRRRRTSSSKAAKLDKASGEPGREVVGRVKMSQLREIAEKKMIDLNANDIDAACRMLAGTARSMGIQVTE